MKPYLFEGLTAGQKHNFEEFAVSAFPGIKLDVLEMRKVGAEEVRYLYADQGTHNLAWAWFEGTVIGRVEAYDDVIKG